MGTTVRLHDVWYDYPDGHSALMGIDLAINAGEKVALMGPNGAGKSTLLLHLNGILIPLKGDVEICDQPVNASHLPHVRSLVGLVFQNPDDQLFCPTVAEDVAYGPIYQGLPPDQINHRVNEALAAVAMQDYVKRSSYHLSMGEKKRIAIASVLSMRPEILVFDEPSAGLDPRARRNLIELLHKLPQTMLIATHDFDLAHQLAQRSVLIYQGKVVADGPTSQVLENPDLLLQYGL